MSDFFPFDPTTLQTGPGRAMYAPKSALSALPDDLDDIYSPKVPYTVISPWKDFGATSDAPQVSRGFTTGGLTIQQSDVALYEEVTESNRTVSVPLAQLTPAAIAILEESAGVTTGAAFDSVPFGSIFDLEHYAFCLVWRKKKSQVLVTEPGPLTRGGAVGWLAYDVNQTADNVQISIGRNTLASATLTFKVNNDASVTTEGTEGGKWLFEKVRTVT